MGKKSKRAEKTSEMNESQSVTVAMEENITKDKKSRKRKNNNESSDLVVNEKPIESEETPLEEPLNKEKKSKSKKTLSESIEQDKKVTENQKRLDLTTKKSKQIDQIEETQEKKTSNKKDKVKHKNSLKQNNQNKSKNKKKNFEEDTGEAIEVSKNKSDKNDIDDLKEEDVKDEDIDKFCNEITEEDNAQYENWVQLIEAKLKSNKSKSKS